MKISEYSAVTDPQDGDEFVIVRAGVNYRVAKSVVFEFTPADISNWLVTPTTVAEALDTLANTAGGGVPPDADYGDIVITAGVWRLDASIDLTGKQLNNGTYDNASIQFSAIANCSITATNSITATDSLFSIQDNGDATKIVVFQVSGLTTGTTRTLTVQDGNGTIAYLTDILGQGTGLDVDAYGFRGIPQNSQSGNYTTVAADAGKHIIHASGGGAGDTFTIDSNANVAYELGTAITFINMDSNALSIAIISDTMNLAGAGTTGTRTLAQYGIATAIKVASTTWLISGTNLT